MQDYTARQAETLARQIGAWTAKRRAGEPTDKLARDQYHQQTRRIFEILYGPETRRIMRQLQTAGRLTSQADELEVLRLQSVNPNELELIAAHLDAASQKVPA
jgi:hypothetical protein